MGKDERTRGRAHNTHTKKEEGLPTEGEEGKTQPAPGGGWQPLPPATPTSGSPAPQMAALLPSPPLLWRPIDASLPHPSIHPSIRQAAAGRQHPSIPPSTTSAAHYLRS